MNVVVAERSGRMSPSLIRWARERADLSCEQLAKKFPRIADWESGDSGPTFAQLKKFAKTTHTPFGYMFLDKQPELVLPIADFRTFKRAIRESPSTDLLDTVHQMLRRQNFLTEFREEMGYEPIQ